MKPYRWPPTTAEIKRREEDLCCSMVDREAPPLRAPTPDGADKSSILSGIHACGSAVLPPGEGEVRTNIGIFGDQICLGCDGLSNDHPV
jgi:hypothetical protein